MAFLEWIWIFWHQEPRNHEQLFLLSIFLLWVFSLQHSIPSTRSYLTAIYNWFQYHYHIRFCLRIFRIPDFFFKFRSVVKFRTNLELFDIKSFWHFQGVKFTSFIEIQFCYFFWFEKTFTTAFRAFDILHGHSKRWTSIIRSCTLHCWR